jgi:hypothetical protein
MSYLIEFEEYEREQCRNCGINYLVPTAKIKGCKEDAGNWFYCPNGHKWHFSESEADKLRRERDQLKQAQARILDEKWEAEETARKATDALKRHKKRAAAGSCPCCKRTFGDMARHMKTKHPDFVEQNSNVVKLEKATA